MQNAWVLNLNILKHLAFMITLSYNCGTSQVSIPLALAKLNIVDYSSLMENLMKKIKLWPNILLSYVRKAQWITSVFILPLPCGIIKHIYIICREFMWTTKHPSQVHRKKCVNQRKKEAWASMTWRPGT